MANGRFWSAWKIVEKYFDINGTKETYDLRDIIETAQTNNEEDSESNYLDDGKENGEELEELIHID